ncbi:MAG: hypothetical protein MUC87_13105 [Bacteroidia bacterium]|jgi:hypothetical protein|nr:hypothetical protein [Bacteroidia bacterium]
MKKSTLIVAALAFGVTTAFAQDLTSKKGEPILPEAGDLAIGIDAMPLLDYFGNFIGGNGNNFGTPSWQFTNAAQMITGKMFVSPTMAYRGMLRIGFGSQTMKNFVTQDGSTATPPATVTDEMKMSGNFIGLGGGLEWRRGKTRLQGYYGAMAMVSFGSSKNTYTYGNPFTSTYTTPTTTSDFLTGASGPAAARTTEEKFGSTIGFGLRGFVGAEYFVLPKLSVGGEFGWGLGLSRTGDGETTVESWNGTAATSTTTASAGNGSFGIDTDNANFGMAPGALFIHFHF